MISEKQARKFCSEDISNIQNYKNAVCDKTQVWCIHHKGEVLPCGLFSVCELKKFGLYYQRPASELVFMTRSEHRAFHNKHLPEKFRLKQRNSLKNRTFTAQHRKNISKAMKGNSNGKGNITSLGSYWWNNGIEQRLCKECPGLGFKRGRLKNVASDNVDLKQIFGL